MCTQQGNGAIRNGMRQKAEKQIRDAAAAIGGRGPFRLDAVRAGAGLHPKIFDKTILDMERVGTILLEPLDESGPEAEETSGLVRRGDRIYVRFAFIDAPAVTPPAPEGPPAPVSPKPAPVDAVVVILQDLLPGEWEAFSGRCLTAEGKSPHEKIEEMIRRYLYTGS
jgi:hypothetical protein